MDDSFLCVKLPPNGFCFYIGPYRTIDASGKRAGLMKRFLLVLALTVCGYAAPVVTNGDFETGDFIGWDVYPGGVATVVSNSPGDGFGGNFHALLELPAIHLPDEQSDLEKFLNLPPGCLDNTALFGSAIRQVVTINDGQELDLDFNWLSEQAVYDSDVGIYLTLGNGPDGDNPFLTPIEGAGIASGVDGYAFSFADNGLTTHFNYTGLGNGTYTLGILLVSQNAATADIWALAVDNIAITPEPGAPEISAGGLAQALPMLLCLVLLRRRR